MTLMTLMTQIENESEFASDVSIAGNTETLTIQWVPITKLLGLQ